MQHKGCSVLEKNMSQKVASKLNILLAAEKLGNCCAPQVSKDTAGHWDEIPLSESSLQEKLDKMRFTAGALYMYAYQNKRLSMSYMHQHADHQHNSD